MERARFDVRLLRRTTGLRQLRQPQRQRRTTGQFLKKAFWQAGLATRLDKSLLFEKHHKQRIFMKRFIPTIAILLPLIFFAACGPSKNPEATASAASPAAAAATIAASPNPVTTGEGSGNTTVTWNTGDGSTGQVYVSMDGAPETLFAGGPTGSAPAPWIQAGKTFEFRLYAGTEHAKVLAKTQVTTHK
jgi:hypothetical protein